MPNQPSGDPRDVAPKPHDLHATLKRDHERLEKLFVELLDQFREMDPDELRNSWTRFEGGLRAHFRAEERYLLPAFGRVEPQESATLLADHTSFRKTLDALGVGVDLHVVSLDVAHGFIDALRAHANREDRLLYEWADRELREADRSAVARGIGEAPAD